jgi:hypothetical protein
MKVKGHRARATTEAPDTDGNRSSRRTCNAIVHAVELDRDVELIDKPFTLAQQ